MGLTAPAGDAVLRAVPGALSGVVRETDSVARLGGDEFAVLAAADAGSSEAGRPAAGGRGRCRRRDRVTSSVGATDVRPGDEGYEVLSRADRAMYRVKGAGGNRVTVLAG